MSKMKCHRYSASHRITGCLASLKVSYNEVSE